MSTDLPDPSDANRRLDAREIDGEPFGDIMAALEDLPEGESLLLVNGFEPEPLYDVLERRGFRYETTRKEPTGDDGAAVWHVEISHA
ncbi:Uncharacterized conserved protein [Halorubrum aquaticum]|uniref:Uncharacterized conserved protein n=1 Tax=Halorubrum aquaticum TaxID=387340 RepID=A0A1I3AF42_9EURY|nr:DUF2249 domain-containing protein [Halorubrum aquaticum]SFH48605.1 Uncharacterized conserved protein [Halorubrum aquaticum]